MKERPILFSGSMVRALLAGRKTQTRRVVKPQPDDSIDSLHGGKFRKRAPYTVLNNDTDRSLGYGFQDESHDWLCPYGQPGDRLWVRETFYCDDFQYPNIELGTCSQAEYNHEYLYYRADAPKGRIDELIPECEKGPSPWKPSIHMPRFASRITLEITGVRVERLNEISEEDAIAEGLERCIPGDPHPLPYWAVPGTNGLGNTDPVYCYRRLWESINGARSWELNPWVWVVEFKVLEGGRP